MNLEESNKVYEKNKQKSAKKQIIMGGIVLCAIIIVICIVGIVYLNNKEANRFKNILDGKEIEISQNFIVNDENGIKYVNIRQLSELVGYNYNQGDYIEVNEDKNSCYIENKYEVVNFKVDENIFDKYIKNDINNVVEEVENEQQEQEKQPQQQEQQLDEEQIVYTVKSEDKEKETFTIENPVKMINEQIYIPLDSVNVSCNTIISIKEKSLEINSLDYLVKFMKEKIAKNEKYEEISNVYENARAIPNDMLVVRKNNLYGVISLETGESILSNKYNEIKYVQNENRFYVYIDSKVGILDAQGNTIISPKEYDSIKVFDEERKWFLIEAKGKYGILSENGEFILHPDLDAIGVSDVENYNVDNLKNKNIWFDKFVAVKKGEKYGLYDTENKEFLVDLEKVEECYDNFGYETTSTDTAGEESLLIVPKETGVEGIVVNVNGMYGIYDINLKGLAIPCACTRMYYITNNGVSTYYMEFNGELLEMREYFETHQMVTAK